ncbi:hypothetical protein [Planctomycetes bacterium CA13]
MQSDHELSKFEPIALYNLQEKPKGNFINLVEQKKRIDTMQREYADIFKLKRRTVPVTNVENKNE